MSLLCLADRVAQLIEGAGVHRVFGVGGANIEDMFAAVQRRRPELEVVLTKHEHGAGTAPDAYARISGGLGVVLATSGGRAMNLVHSLAEPRSAIVSLREDDRSNPAAPRLETEDGASRSACAEAQVLHRLAHFQREMPAASVWHIACNDGCRVPHRGVEPWPEPASSSRTAPERASSR